MGADPYWYYVPYEEDKNSALQKLRKREFMAGRYRPVVYTGELFPIDESSAPTYRRMHETIEDALSEAAEEGTGSILDLCEVSEEEYFNVAHIMEKEKLIKYFNTEKPTRDMVEKKIGLIWDDIYDSIGVRGVGICITVYQNEEPSELFFMGYSWD